MRRSGNFSHYECMAEEYIIKNKISYMAINEGKKAFANSRKVKNFDFLISGKRKITALDIKGRHFGYAGAPSNLWENWILEDDITGMENWQKEFKKSGVSIEPVFMYTYLLRDKKHYDFFQNIFTFKGKTYGLVGITLKDYKKHLKVRSNSPRSVCVNRKTFASLVKPIDYFI